MSAYTDYLDSLINDSLTKVGVKPSTVMPASTAPTPAPQPAPSPQPAQQGNYNLNFKYTLPQQAPQPSKPSGGGFFGALKDIGGGLGGAVSDVAHLNNPLPSLNTAAQGVGEVFNSGSKYVGLPLAEVLAGSAGNIGGRYSKAKSPLDAIDKVLNAYKNEFTTNPLTTYKRAVQGGQEMQAEANNAGPKIGGVPVLGTALSLATNPLTFVPGLGAANLAEGAAKVALPAIGATVGGAAAQNLANKVGVPQRFDPLVGLAGSVAGGGAAAKLGPEGVARIPQQVGDVAAKTGIVPEGAVPGAGMVRGSDPHLTNLMQAYWDAYGDKDAMSRAKQALDSYVAADVGKPRILFHGSRESGLSELRPGEQVGGTANGLFLSENPEVAGYYGANVYPLHVTDAGILDISDETGFRNFAERVMGLSGEELDDAIRWHDEGTLYNSYGSRGLQDDIVNTAKAMGFKGVVFNDSTGQFGAHPSYVLFDSVPAGGGLSGGAVTAGGVEAPAVGDGGTGAPPPQTTSEPPSGGSEPPIIGGNGPMQPAPQPSPLPGTEQVGPLLLPEPPTGPKPLSNVDKLYNAIVPHITGGLEREDTARPIMQYRQMAQQVVDSQAKAAANKVDYLVNSKDPDTGKPVFTFDKNGRITDLVGNPTIQDLAARLPDFEPLLSPAQKAVIGQLQDIFGPWGNLVRAHDIDLGNRTDIKPGGFYIPRGRADLEGADAPVVKGGGRGGKSGYRKTASFDSMMQGLDAGYQYAPLKQAAEAYVKQAGNDVVDSRVASYFKSLTDEEGNPLASTAAERVPEGLRQQWKATNARLASIKGRLQTAEQRAGLAERGANELTTPLEKLKNAIGDRATTRKAFAQAYKDLRDAQKEAVRTARVKGAATAADQVAQAAFKAVQARAEDAMTRLQEARKQALGYGEVTAPGGIRLPALNSDAVTKAVEDAELSTKELRDMAARGTMPINANGKSAASAAARGTASAAAKDALASMRAETDAALDAAKDVSPDAAHTAIRQMGRRVAILRSRGSQWSGLADSMDQSLEAAKARVDELAPQWRAALDRARQTPRNQSTIPLNQLQGYSFPDALAAVARKTINDSGPLMGRGSQLAHVINAFNNIFRGLRASADVSFMGIQGLLGAARDPVGYGKAVAVAYRSMADPRVLGKYLVDFDAKAAAQGLPDSRTLIANGLHVGGAQSEFAIGGGIAGRAERIGTGDTPLVKLNPLRGSNRAFGYFGDAMRLELAKTFAESAGKHWGVVGEKGGFDLSDPATLQAITRAANLSTGWAPNAMGGDIGTMVEFAPRYLQSQISLIADAVKGLAKGPLGKASVNETEARQMLLRLISAGATLTIAANEAQGEPLSWRELLDPTYNHGANFMRIRFKGQDISLFGPWDSLVKGVVALGSGDTGYIARSKASPAVSTLWDLATGKTFTGQTATLAFAKDPKAATEYALRNLVAPFSVSDIGKQPPLGTAIGLTGLKSSPLSPTEDLNRVSQLKYGKDYYNLLPTQQQAIQKDYPDLYQRKLENQQGAAAQYQQIKTQMTQQQAALDQAFLDGNITRDQWKNQYDSFNQQLAGAGMAIYGNEPITNPKNAQQRYLQIVQENTDPATQIVDWNAVDEGVSQLSQDDQTWIADNQTVGKTPLVAQYKQAQQERQQYNDLPVYSGYTADQARQIDQLVAEARANSRSSDDGAMLSALRRVTAGQSNIDPVILRGARKSIIGVLHQLTVRKRFAATHPLMTAFYGGAGKATNTSLTPQEQALLGGGQ